jgi:hypothetical protein
MYLVMDEFTELFLEYPPLYIFVNKIDIISIDSNYYMKVKKKLEL